MSDPPIEPAEPPKPAAPPTRSSRMERLRVGADAMFAVQKALLTLLVGFLVLAALVVLVGRGITQRSINVTLTDKSEAALTTLGSDLDLPATLVEALNDQVRGVQGIVKLDAIGAAIAQTADPLSLQLFGLNLNSDEITGLMRRLLGSTPPPSAAISLACVPGPCDTPTGRAGLTLHVDVVAGGQSQRLAYPLPVANPGLRRALRAAMRRTAERLMEATEPLAASVYFLNQSAALQVFGQQGLDSTNQAAGVSFAVADPRPASACLAKVVYGLAEARRGDEAVGVAALQAAGRKYPANRGCQVAVQTDLVIVYINDARCGAPGNRDENFKQAEDALGQLAKLDQQDFTTAERLRIKAFKVELDLTRLFVADLSRDEWTSICYARPGRVQGGGSATDPRPLLSILRRLPSELPAGGDQTLVHQVLDYVEQLAPLVLRDDAIAARYRVARMIAAVSETYAESDRAPHEPFLTRGRAELDMELLVAQARVLDGAAQQRIVDSLVPGPPHTVLASSGLFDAAALLTSTAALVAFENAEHTRVVAPLLEGDSRLDALVLEGDARFAEGFAEAAAGRYAQAVQTFADEDEPASDLPWLARAAAHWSALLLRNHACAGEAALDQDWDQAFARLGASRHADLCLLRRQAPLPPDEAAQFGLLSTVFPLVHESLDSCVGAGAGSVGLPGLLMCLRQSGPDSPGTVQSFFRDHTDDWFDRQVQAMAATHAP